MQITVYMTAVDGAKVTRKYKTLEGARKFAQSYVGTHPEFGSGYAISDDGVCKVTVMGVALPELFPEKTKKNGNGSSTTWTPESIKKLLATNDQAVINAVLALTDRQTYEEQAGGVTIKRNNVGFNANDAFLSKFAGFYRERGYFSPKMLNISRRRIMKYTRQLLEVAEEKGHSVSYK